MAKEYTQPFEAQSQYASESRNKISDSVTSVAELVIGAVAMDSPCRAIWVGTSGDLVLHFSDGTSATFLGLTAGLHPLAVVRATTAGGSDASNVLALF